MKNILSRLPFYTLFGEIVKTSTFKQSSITFIGTAANGILGAIFYIITARYLGPAQFGIMTVALAIMTLITDVGDFGTDTGLVNFVSKYIKNEPDKASKFLKLGLEIKLSVYIAVLVLGYFSSEFIAENIFSKPELIYPLKITFIGVGAMLLFSFVIHALQAMQRFWAWSLLQVFSNALRLILILMLIYFSAFTIGNTLWLYILMPFLGFILGIYLIGPKLLKVKGEREIAKEFFRYNKWVAGFAILAAIGSRVDTFISARILSAEILGVYSAANQLVRMLPMIVVAIGTVISPKMASLSSIKELVKYLKKTQILVLGLSLLGILSMPVVLWLIKPIFGSEYIASGPIFIVLLFAMLIFLMSVPVHTAVFYYFSYPKLFFWLSLTHLILTAVLGWVLISTYGAIGAATTVLIGQVISFIVPFIWVLKRIKSSSDVQ